MLYRLYIGANNTTGIVEKQKALSIASQAFEGFTAIEATGYWQSQPENTLLLEIETRKAKQVYALAHTLAQELEQQAVGVFSPRKAKMDFIS